LRVGAAQAQFGLEVDGRVDQPKVGEALANRIGTLVLGDCEEDRPGIVRLRPVEVVGEEALPESEHEDRHRRNRRDFEGLQG
jgi:hypothetical protein